MKQYKIKTLLSIFTVFCLLLGCIPIASAAVGDTVTVEEACKISKNTSKSFVVNIREDGIYSLAIYALKGKRNVDASLKIGSGDAMDITLIAGGNNSVVGTTVIEGFELEANAYTITLSPTQTIDFEKLIFTKTSGGILIPEPDPEPTPTLPVLTEKSVFSSDKIIDGVISFGSDSEENAYKLSVIAENTEGITYNVYVNNELAVSGADIENLGNYVFPIGDNELKIESVGGDAVISEVRLTKYDPSQAPISACDINVQEPLSDVLDEGFFDKSGVFDLNSSANPPHITLEDTEWVRYKANVAEEGRYLVYITYGTWNNQEWFKIENETSEDFFRGILPASGVADYNKPVVSTKMDKNDGVGEVDVIIDMVAGENILKVTKSDNRITLFNIRFELISNKVDSYSVYAGDVPMLGTNKITPSADTMTIYFTNPVLDSSLSNKMTLTDASGNEYPVSANSDGSKVNIELLKSLQPETVYTLSVAGVAGEKETMENLRTYTFTTSQEKNDGCSVVSLTNVETSYETITASGCISGSHGKGIANRRIKMYLVKGSERTLIKEFKSGENGIFEVTAEIDSNLYDSGKYTLHFEPQYDIVSTAAQKIIYVDSDVESDIKAAFKNADDIQKVQQAFSDYESYMPFNASGDVTSVGTNLYSHFVNYEITDMNSFYSYYNKMYLFEGMRTSSSTSDLKEFLYDQANCSIIGIDYNKVSLIINNENAYLADVMSISENDYDKYIEELTYKTDKYLLIESGKADVALSIPDINANMGQSFTGSIIASFKQDGLKKSELNMTFNSLSAIDDTVTVTSDFKGSGTVDIDSTNKTVKIAYVNDNPEKAEKLFDVKFTAAAEGSYTVSYSGKLYFDYKGYELVTEIKSGSFNINIKKLSSPGGGGGGGGGGSVQGPSSSKPTTNTKPDNKEEPTTQPEQPDDSKEEPTQQPDKTEPIFKDIENYSWAEESILNLVERGVISANEEKQFRPSDNITREEFVKMIVCLLGIRTTSKKNEFSDVPMSHWAHEYILAAVENGIVSGVDDSTFGLGEKITREQMAAILGRVLTKYGYIVDISDVENFEDKNEISDYAKESVLVMRHFEIINGVGGNRFAPKLNALRAEAARMIYGFSKVVGQ